MGFMDKVKAGAAAAKAGLDERRQKAADEKRRQEQLNAEREKQLATEREASFVQAQKTSPLPLHPEKMPIAGGLDLFNDEFVVSVAKEWGWSTQRLTLTTHRVLWSKGVINTEQKTLYLTDIRDVKYHKPFMGAASIILETAGGLSIEGLPAASNGSVVRDRLLAMIHWARQRQPQPAAPAATVAAPRPPDRLDQLRRVGELRAQGILSEDEFQAEKTKLLAQAG
jgi:hypothetical protein